MQEHNGHGAFVLIKLQSYGKLFEQNTLFGCFFNSNLTIKAATRGLFWPYQIFMRKLFVNVVTGL